MNTRIEQLLQIFNAAVWDGNLISKKERDNLRNVGLIKRAQGWNFITPKGIRYLSDLNLIRSTNP